MEVKIGRHNFEAEVINSSKPVLVDFWAPWCGPCKAIAPYIEDIANEFKGKIKVCKLNVDDEPDIASRYAVMSIPTLMVFRGGKVMEKKVGMLEKDKLVKFIQPYVDVD